MQVESLRAATYEAVVYASRRPAPQDLTRSRANRTVSAISEALLGLFEALSEPGQRIGYGSRKR